MTSSLIFFVLKVFQDIPVTRCQEIFPLVLASLLQVDIELLSSMAKFIYVTLINEHPAENMAWNNYLVNLSCNKDILLMRASGGKMAPAFLD